MRERIRRWLGLDAIDSNVLAIIREQAHQAHILDTINGRQGEVLARARDAEGHAIHSRHWAEQVATTQGITTFRDAKCPNCGCVYSDLIQSRRQASLVCRCGKHLEVYPDGHVEVR